MVAAHVLTGHAQEQADETSGTLATSTRTPLANLPGRQRRSLNGDWQVMVDAYASGMSDWKAVWKDQTPAGKHDLYE